MGSAATSLSSPSTIDRDQWNRYFDEMCKADGDDSEVVTYQTLVDWATKCVKKRNHQADAWLKEWGATQELPKAFRTVELDALQSAVATGSQNHQMLSAQLLPLETLAKTIPSRLVGEIFLTNKSALEAAVHDADKLRVYSHRAFKEMIPTVISEITPSLVSTRSRYDVVYDQVLKNDAEALSQLGKQLALMNTSAGPDSTKPVQHLSSSSLNEFFGCDNEDDLPDSARSNPKFMLGLLRDAVETKSIFDAEMNRIGQELDGTVACKLAPLKGMERALVKVHEKYSGVYAELTDMVRATFLCDSVSDMVRVAQALQASDAFECKRSKHRMSPTFNAEGVGGYRDVLTNVQCNGHLCEVQVNLNAFVEVKSGGGHAVYNIARMVHAFDPLMSTFVAGYDDCSEGLVRVSQGVVKNLQLFRKEEWPANEGPTSREYLLENPLPRMAPHFESKCCQLVQLRLAYIHGLGSLSAILSDDACTQLAPTLRELRITGCQGMLPGFPLGLCRLKRLRVLDLNDCRLGLMSSQENSTTLPPEIGNLERLEVLYLSELGLSGCLPPELGKCTKLKELRASMNPDLAGPIPVEIATGCVALESLSIIECSIAGDNLPFQEFFANPNFKQLSVEGYADKPRAEIEQRARAVFQELRPMQAIKDKDHPDGFHLYLALEEREK